LPLHVDTAAHLAQFGVNDLLTTEFPEAAAVFLRVLGSALLVVSAAALPAAAGDRHSDHRFSHHHGHSRVVLGERPHWDYRGVRFAGDSHRHHRDRMRFLKQFSSPARYARGSIVVIAPQFRDGGSGGTYAGSSYAYQVDGGTYFGGDGYASYPVERPERLAPKAKIIEVAAGQDPCAYEAGVCVIRP
jgi:hypothetical protein